MLFRAHCYNGSDCCSVLIVTMAESAVPCSLLQLGESAVPCSLLLWQRVLYPAHRYYVGECCTVLIVTMVQSAVSCSLLLWQRMLCRAHCYYGGECALLIVTVEDSAVKGNGKVFYGQEPPSEESTTTECRVNYITTCSNLGKGWSC